MHLSTRKRLLVILCAYLFISTVQAQIVESSLPDDFFVCGTSEFEITVTTDNSDLTDLELCIDFSTLSGAFCGILYQNAEGVDLSVPFDSLSPCFILPDLAVGESFSFILEAKAPCGVLECINDGELFRNCFNLTSGGVSIFSNCTEFYPIETANLIITELSPSLVGGLALGDVVTRTIKVLNSRLGPLEEFVFCDDHQGGFCITTNYGSVISEDDLQYCVLLNSEDFMNIGDGDGLFEEGEMIIIQEEIEVKSCGNDPSSSLSNIRVSWGCESQTCQEDIQTAALSFVPTSSVPQLSFQPITTVAECFCGPEPLQQGMVVTNNGSGTALDFNLTINDGGATGGMDLLSFYADSAGTELELFPVPAVFEPSLPLAVCEIDPEVFNRIIVPFPQIAPGESITLYWDTYVCEVDCNSEGINWLYGYGYDALCGNPIFVADTIGVSDVGAPVQVSLISDDPFEDGMVYTFDYAVSHDNMSQEDGTLTVELEVPCGLTWLETNEALLCGQMPQISFDSLEEAQLVTLEYDLPMCADSVAMSFDLSFSCMDFCTDDLICMDSIQTTCPLVDDCFTPFENVLIFPVTTTVNHCSPFPNNCAPQNCRDFIFDIGCEIDSICLEIVQGYTNQTFSVQRSNIAPCDPDNDQIPGGPGDCDPELLRLDRAIVGDTIHFESRNEVVVDVPGTTFSQGRLEMFLTGGAVTGLNQDFFTPSSVEEIFSSVQIYDSSEDIWYDCEDIPLISVDSVPFIYLYDFSPATLADQGCAIPSSLELDQGDSILFNIDYRLNRNVLREMDGTPLSLRLNFTPSVLIFNDPEANLEDIFRCGCDAASIEVTGYEYSVFPGVFAVPPCDESAFIGGSLFQFILEEGNFFPYEYRNFATLLDWKVTIPDEFQLIESQLTFLRYQDGADVFTDQPLNPSFDGDQYCFEMADLQYPPTGLDEGFLALFQYRFTSDCDLIGSHEMTVEGNILLDAQLGETPNPLALEVTSNALRSLIPNLVVDATFFDITPFDNNAVFDFNIINFQTLVAAQQSGTAPNLWVYPVSNSGLIDSCLIVNPQTGIPFPNTNGIFQLDSLPANDSIPLQLICKNNSCELENITLNFGWSCDPFTNPINVPCYVDSKVFTVVSPPGELEMEVLSPSDCSELCDTVPYHTIEIFNAELGCVYNTEITAQAPSGLSFLSGSAQIEYPCGSDNFVDVVDPTILSNGDFQWSLCDLIPSLDDCCLPPVTQSPNNCFRLRFQGQTSCDFTANSQFIIRTQGEQNCGIPTNSPVDPGAPICIEDVTPPYTANLSINSESIICSDTVEHTVAVTVMGDTQFGDCVIVETPAGIEYVEGSCNAVSNPPIDCMVQVDPEKITIPLPEGVTAGNIIVFNFSTTGYADLDCGQLDMTFQSATQTLANCAALNEDCSIKVTTGSAQISLTIERPILELSNFIVSASPLGGNDLVQYDIDISNEGEIAEAPIFIEFYKDNNGDGTGDELVAIDMITEDIPNGEEIHLAGSFEMASGMLCQLVADLVPTCACEISGTSVEMPITYFTGQNDTICSQEIALIGIEEKPGFTYQWTSPDDPNCIDLLECPTCPLTNFSFENNFESTFSCDFVLLETDNMGCTIQNVIEINIQPEPKICLADLEVCAGESANICACNGVDFQWDPVAENTSCIVVQPQETTTYSVTITDELGCTGVDEVTIIVNDFPEINLPSDTVFCPGEIPQFDIGLSSGYTYTWSPGNPILDNPTIHNPTIELQMDGFYTVSVTANNCTSIDSVDVTFGENPDLTISDNQTICLSNPTTITVTGADSYIWEAPITQDNCLNPECSTVEVNPTETTTYTVTGFNTDGCGVSLSSTIEVVDDFIMEVSNAGICEGQSIELFGEIVSEAGLYCDTIPLPSGCDSLICVNLQVNTAVQTDTSATICDGDIFEINGNIFTESGQLILSTQAGCDSIINVNLNILPLPEFTIEAPDEVLPEDSLVLFIEEVFPSYNWESSAGSTLNDCDGTSECLDFPITTTTYTVTVIDENNCLNTNSVTVNVLIDCNPAEVEIPNAFTPNGDEFNSHFGPVLIEPGLEELQSIQIWNRWGEKVFSSSGDNRWDGTYNGEPAAPDVYIYSIKLGCSFGDDEAVLTGDVTLIR